MLVYICQSQSPDSYHHPSPTSPLVSIHLFSTSVSLFLPCKPVHLYHFSRFLIYALIYDICFSLSDLLHSIWQSLGPLMSLQKTQFCSFLWLIFHCTFVTRLLYPFVCQWAFRLLPWLAIVNSAAMNIRVHVSFWIMVSSRYMLNSGITGSYGNSIFSFLRTSILFSIVAVSIYIPTNSVRGFPFLHTLSSICCL